METVVLFRLIRSKKFMCVLVIKHYTSADFEHGLYVSIYCNTSKLQ